MSAGEQLAHPCADWRHPFREMNQRGARTVDELRQAIAQQNSDIRLIREIVTRLDPGPQRKP